MTRINLTKGKYSIVDSRDYEFLNQWKWHYHEGYACRTKHIGIYNGKRKRIKIFMHRLLIDIPEGMEVDHKNGNRADNRRWNLRICTRSQNNHNQKKTRGVSKYKGVTWDKNRKLWSALIRNGKVINLGRFELEIEAALAYNKAANKFFGKFARLNKVEK